MRSITVEYIGVQRDDTHGDFPLYNLLEPMNGHPVYSTVSLNTIRAAGYCPFVVKVRGEQGIFLSTD
jgi:hypothetical protein